MTKKFHTQIAKDKKTHSFRGMVELEFADKKGIPNTIHLIPVGQWEHDMYGPIIINSGDIREYIQNFNQGVRKGVFITAGHEGFQELPAVGWVKSVEARDTGLWGEIEWNEEGKRLLSDKAFKFFSPEMCRDYEDPETHQFYRNVMTGGALTKSPYFKELEAIVFSEKGTQINRNNFNEKTMNLKDLLAKEISTLTDEEKAFIKEHAAELSEDEKASHTAIIEEPTGTEETAEEKNAREHKEADEQAAKEKADTEAANVAAGLNPDGTAKEEAPADAGAEEEIQASEKKNITISASEYSALKEKADKGAQAFAELETTKLNAVVATMMFSESNKTGTFLPKGKDSVLAFMKTLSAAQRLSFSEVLKHVMKNADKFTEEGDGGTEGGTSQAELENKVKIKMSENPNLKYSEALKLVLSENAGLEERYDKELPSARKK